MYPWLQMARNNISAPFRHNRDSRMATCGQHRVGSSCTGQVTQQTPRPVHVGNFRHWQRDIMVCIQSAQWKKKSFLVKILITANAIRNSLKRYLHSATRGGNAHLDPSCFGNIYFPDVFHSNIVHVRSFSTSLQCSIGFITSILSLHEIMLSSPR